ncbi:ArsR family transcriptional regulator [Sporolactobacillus sp. THM7-4]|nr:ArsR family transcriptional regulator [Sporolactobacillus sp. THM7-4]
MKVLKKFIFLEKSQIGITSLILFAILATFGLFLAVRLSGKTNGQRLCPNLWFRCAIFPVLPIIVIASCSGRRQTLNINSFSETKREILKVLKEVGSASIAMLQSKLDLTGEALRQHLLQLRQQGFVERKSKKSKDSSGGRPAKQYYLTLEGEHLFPKNYDQLTMEIIDTVADNLGQDALLKILETMTKTRIRKWEPQLQGLDVNERVNELKGLYLQDDAFMEIEETENAICLIEHNCPFLNVAMKRPALCSVTVSTLTRLLGYKVERTERFQNGNGRCVFRISLDQPVDADLYPFTLEE